ncbi:MAG TPA: NosD domain-containing protein, partial [Candidatus Acidoferrum sp.]|nr:NosD domain-containing protein [Candidatus Acidoferrum sp.]
GSGLSLTTINNVTIENINIRDFQNGIILGSSSNNTVSSNTASANIYGVWLDSSSNNTLYHNNFMNNTYQVGSVNSTNTWDDGYPSGGNYWSDYTGVDKYSGPNQNYLGSDGIGDTPYVIDANNTDHYPLMKPYAVPIYIYSNGSVYPSSAPISTPDKVTYTLTGNISYPTCNGVVVERSNIVIDGNGYTVKGDYPVPPAENSNGIDLTDVSNVTIKNVDVEIFGNGIYLDSSSDDILSGNTATANYVGIFFDSSSNNIVSENNLAADFQGIDLYGSSSNTITGNNATANSLYGIFLEGSSNNTASWNIAAANKEYGIYLDSSSNNTVSSNIAIANQGGIFFDFSSNNDVSGNNASSNEGGGITLDYSSNNNNVSSNDANANNYGIGVGLSSNNTVSSNDATSNKGEGIALLYSSNDTFRANTMLGNWYNFEVDGSVVSDFMNDVDSSNTVDGKPVYYWVNVNNSSVPLDAGYVALINCTGITVQGLSLTNNWPNILLEYTSYTNITNDSFQQNYGAVTVPFELDSDISLEHSSDNNISGNNITYAQQGTGNGISLNYSPSNIISGNNITNNGYGLYLISSSNNTIFHNEFINNTYYSTYQVYSDNSTNIWDDGYPSGGNYWSDYNGSDLYSGPFQNVTGSDGIGDTPYIIDANNIDHYPIIPEFPSFLILLLFFTATLLAGIIHKRRLR